MRGRIRNVIIDNEIVTEDVVDVDGYNSLSLRSISTFSKCSSSKKSREWGRRRRTKCELSFKMPRRRRRRRREVKVYCNVASS